MGKIFSMTDRRGRGGHAPEEAAAAELNDLRKTPQEPEAGERPAFAMSEKERTEPEPITVSPAQFAKIAGVGHNLVRAWCHLPGFPVHREGWRFHINVELGVRWLRERAVSREGLSDELPTRSR